jgi:RNA polymerase sigma factor (sigma-70 family)
MADGARGNSAEETDLLAALLERGASQKHWAAFVKRYERLIASCVVKALRRYGAAYTREDLDDLVGDVWLTLLRDDMKKLRQYDATRGFRIASFLGLVATNATIDHLRARQAEATPIDDVVEDHVSLRVEPAPCRVEQHEAAALARAALDELSADERAFVLGIFHEERAPEELAKSLGVSTNTVYSRKFKIREKLQKIVATLEVAA